MFNRFPKSKGHSVIPHRMNEFVNDFGIQEFQRPPACIHQRHVDAEGSKHRGIFETDHPCAHDDHGSRKAFQTHHFITGDNLRILAFHPKRRSGNGAHGNQDMFRLNPLQGFVSDDLDRLGVNEGRFAPNHHDVVALQLSFHHLPFSFPAESSWLTPEFHLVCRAASALN